MKILSIILIALAVIFLLIFIICIFVFNQLVWYKPIKIPSFIERAISGNQPPENFKTDLLKAQNKINELPLEALTLTADNGETLKATLYVPEKSNGKIIIACHGARSTGLGEFCLMVNYFIDEGFTVLMPEHRGCGISDGKFMGYGTHESKDTLLWLKYAEKRFPDLDIFLLGVSMGGATVLMMSDKIEKGEVKGIVSDCAYTSAWKEFSYQLRTSFHLPDFPALYICDLLCRIFCGYSFKQAAPEESVKNAKAPILFIHGKADDYVPYYMEKELYDACSSEKYIVGIEDAVHAANYYTDRKTYEKTLNEFFERYSHSEVQK